MTLEEFHNALRILISIDEYELIEAGVQMTDEKWKKFDADPVRFFIRADNETATKIWSIVTARQARAFAE